MAPAKPGWRDEQSEEAIEAKQGVDMRGADDAIVASLRKRSLTGALYERDPKTNALISGLAARRTDHQGSDQGARRSGLHPERMSRLPRIRLISQTPLMKGAAVPYR
jgi:hypothetical protein